MKNPKLSILICSLPSRLKDFSLIEEVTKQANGLPVEVLYLGDNWKKPTGVKRNILKMAMSGERGLYADDDDEISPDYVSELLAAHEENPNVDVITYNVWISQNGGPKEPVHYSIEFRHDKNGVGVYYRIPNHLMAFRKDLLQSVDFQPITMGEDATWARAIKHKVNRQHYIDKYLYTYHANIATSESLKNIGLRHSQ